MSNQTISFPRELSDDLAEFLAEKARVCGGGAYDIWEALCERFGQAGAQHQGEPVAWRVQRITPTGNHRLDRPLLTLATPDEWGPAWKAEPLYIHPAEQPAPVAMVPPEQWQPIETAPKDGTEIILRKGNRITAGAWIEWSKHHAEHHSTTGEYLGQVEYDSGAHWASWDGGFCEDDEPTHWRPLPTPPQQ